MSSPRRVIEHALTAYYADNGNEQADQVVRVLLHNYDDAHRNQVLTEDGQEYNGELATYRGLVATLRAVAKHGDIDDVRKLLAEHAGDDAAARVRAGERR
jgi:hypothetical protein